MRRQSGILLHISSLPSRYGIGSLGQAAYQFVDFLEASGQTLWQVLPIGVTGFGDSPYQSFSTFAGNPYFIDLEELLEQDLLEPAEVQAASQNGSVDHVEYGMLFETRLPLLKKAALRGYGRYGAEEQDFYRENEDWLPDYSLFMALKKHFSQKPYWEWPKEIRDREESAMEHYRELLVEDISSAEFNQFLFDRQWRDLKEYASRHEVEIIGDLPIYVAEDSADTWSHPELFMLDENRRPTEVAGVPPDAFSAEGQLWGNPIYNWAKHKETRYAWWVRRLEKAVERHDLVRIDHFRGFAGYYSVPGGSVNAIGGEWKKGPGMEVLLFGFDGDDSEYLCHNYTYNSVAYIGTHDNETLNGWIFNPKTPAVSRQNAMEYMRLRESEGYHWGAIRTLMASVSQRVIFQMQDVLGLGNYARMNTPATSMGNWQWRMRADVMNDTLISKLRKCVETYHRNTKE